MRRVVNREEMDWHWWELPWTESVHSRLENVPRDVLGYYAYWVRQPCEASATGEGGGGPASYRITAACSQRLGEPRREADDRTRSASNPKQERGQRPEAAANHSTSRDGLPGIIDSQAGIRSRGGGFSEDQETKRWKTASERAPSASDPADASTNGGDGPVLGVEHQ